MKLLYSNILPLRATPGQELFIDRFAKAISLTRKAKRYTGKKE